MDGTEPQKNHVARLRRCRRRRRRAYAPASNTASHELHGFPLISHDAYWASPTALRAGKLRYQ